MTIIPCFAARTVVRSHRNDQWIVKSARFSFLFSSFVVHIFQPRESEKAACRYDERKGLPFRWGSLKVSGGYASVFMTRISFDTPCYFFTSVTHRRLPVFRTDKFKELLCSALNEARNSSGMLYFAYAIMPDHFHIVTDGKRSPSESLRYLNGVTARRIIDHLKKNGPEASLAKLRLAEKQGDYKYSLWEHHADKFLLTSESLFMQKVRYINNNPVADGIVNYAEEYRFSSARYWSRKPILDDEPLEMDIREIKWYSR